MKNSGRTEAQLVHIYCSQINDCVLQGIILHSTEGRIEKSGSVCVFGSAALLKSTPYFFMGGAARMRRTGVRPICRRREISDLLRPERSNLRT
jgi:hypothetical protein